LTGSPARVFVFFPVRNPSEKYLRASEEGVSIVPLRENESCGITVAIKESFVSNACSAAVREAFVTVRFSEVEATRVSSFAISHSVSAITISRLAISVSRLWACATRLAIS
jgi:hypothetical protein